jgi:DmsE family decaheme c-type cytochrome
MSCHAVRIALLFPILLIASSLFPANAAESKWTGEIDTCARCHRKIVETFRPTAHGKNIEFGADGMTCSTCHTGDVAQHARTSKKEFINNPGNEKPEIASEGCLKCHTNSKNMMFWRGSSHENAAVACSSCHNVHTPNVKGQLLNKASETDTCATCHVSVTKAKFQRSTHLVRDERGMGRMECSACHNPHGSQTDKLIAANHVNEKCYECHQDKRGPLLFEHAPVRENCQSCHTAHGSNNTSLLNMRVPLLCQSCHQQPRHGTSSMTANSFFNVGRSCGACHSQIHGTNHPSGVYFMR